MKRLEYLRKTEERLSWALGELGANPPLEHLTELSRLIVDGTSGRWRYFHNPDHLFAVAGEEDPVEVLAGLYHDLLYVQVDQAIFLNLACQVSAVVAQDGDRLMIRTEDALPDVLAIALSMAVFGFEPGQILDPQLGQNEFLSAVVAARVLDPYLEIADLARVLACIELTIPFRRPDAEGLSPAEGLMRRMQAADAGFALGLGEDGCEDAVHRAIRLTVRDLSGFTLSSAHFMDNTWCLLPETNNVLLNAKGYSVRDYRRSLMSTHDFFGRVDPGEIFPSFRGQPDAATRDKLARDAGHNLEVGHLYLTAKLAALGVLEALSERVGVQTPVSLLMDDLESPSLPHLEVPEPESFASPLEQEVFDLLARGRTQDQDYDLINSPVAALFFATLGGHGIKALYRQGAAYFDGEISGDEVIAYAPPDLVEAVKGRIAGLMSMRIDALRKTP